jgi:hypothetical protein
MNRWHWSEYQLGIRDDKGEVVCFMVEGPHCTERSKLVADAPAMLQRIKELETIIDNLEAQATFCDMGDGVDGWKAWAHIPKEEWDSNMELWKKYVASRQ